MKLSVACNFDDALLDGLRDYPVYEIYGKLTSDYFGGGRPEIQSAIDAIAGTPPDIMPFGLQYTFLPKNEPEIYFYRFRPEEPRLKEVLPYVQAVQKLNARISGLEMKELNILKDDGAVQESVFADGTRVIANFSNAALDIKGHGRLPAESFKVTR